MNQALHLFSAPGQSSQKQRKRFLQKCLKADFSLNTTTKDPRSGRKLFFY
jgi:hypothetical protein